MGRLHWSDGSIIEGLAISSAGPKPTIQLDFNLPIPGGEDESADADYVSALAQHGFLPDDPTLIREGDILEVYDCLQMVKHFLQNDLISKDQNEIIMAMTCICYRDDGLRKAAIEKEYRDPEVMARFLEAWGVLPAGL